MCIMKFYAHVCILLFAFHIYDTNKTKSPWNRVLNLLIKRCMCVRYRDHKSAGSDEERNLCAKQQQWENIH